MLMFEALAEALAAGLKLWASKEKTKYIDKLIELKKAWYEEFNKDPSNRNDAVLDNLQFELRVLAIAFSSSVGEQDASVKP